jgi:hypothetical protein
MRNPEQTKDEQPSLPIDDPEFLKQEAGKSGHIAEEAVLKFLQQADIGLANIEKTQMFGADDRNGIDAIANVGGTKLAIDITFNEGKKLEEKMQRNMRNPCVFMHDEAGKPVGEALPRLLIRDISMANWIVYAREAEKRGGNLLDAMGEKFIADKKLKFLNDILDQIDAMSKLDKNYGRIAFPAKDLLQDEYIKIKQAKK